MTHPYASFKDRFLALQNLTQGSSDSFICVKSLSHICFFALRDLNQVCHMLHVSFMCAKFLIPMCDLTHSYV